jgi:hypothetical protein
LEIFPLLSRAFLPKQAADESGAATKANEFDKDYNNNNETQKFSSDGSYMYFIALMKKKT